MIEMYPKYELNFCEILIDTSYENILDLLDYCFYIIPIAFWVPAAAAWNALAFTCTGVPSEFMTVTVLPGIVYIILICTCIFTIERSVS